MRLAAWLWSIAVGVVAAAAAPAAPADERQEERTAFKVCADPSDLPFSNEKGEGFENKIAELFAAELQLPLQYFFFPNRVNFVRNTLRHKLPGQDYRCDIIIGVPVGFDQVVQTRPYFRSTHALVYVKGGKLDGVRSLEDLLALGDRLKDVRIGAYDRSPAATWLERHKLLGSGVPFKMLNADPDFYPGDIIEKSLVNGEIDAAIVWGPVAGYSATRLTGRELVLIPLKSEPGVKFDFAVAMGVRRGEPEWKAQIDALIAANQERILQILRDFNVPLVDDNGDPVP
jgi:quinoprotein dehydrogenase-associated probable ABC transporter substrate-binding protein